jgi:hypothetical protein
MGLFIYYLFLVSLNPRYMNVLVLTHLKCGVHYTVNTFVVILEPGVSQRYEKLIVETQPEPF